jgi:release factor glutamine methyltransferase
MAHAAGELIKLGYEKLVPTSTSALLDSQVLLSHLTNKPRTWLLSHPETKVNDEIENQYLNSIDQMAAGVPLPYIVGQWEFFGMTFELTPDTLIPRPETELLVEHALAWTRAQSGDKSVLDVGTGSGCIAIALTKHEPRLYAIALDISHAALIVASHNAHAHQVQRRVHFVQADLRVPFPFYPNHPYRFDIICSNPPYIPKGKLVTLPVSQHEPRRALDGGEDGIELITALLLQAALLLNPGGLLLMEIDTSHADKVKTLTADHFPDADIHLLLDLAGKDRLIVVEHHPT